MKNLPQVRKELENIFATAERRGGAFSKADRRAFELLSAQLKWVCLYLETNPREDFIRKMLADIEAKIKRRKELAAQLSRDIKDLQLRKRMETKRFNDNGTPSSSC